jgi:chromate transport protein ChrA
MNITVLSIVTIFGYYIGGFSGAIVSFVLFIVFSAMKK